MAYDKIFRERVIAYKDAGHTHAEVYEAFRVHPGRYHEWKKLQAETGSLKFRTAQNRKGKIDIERLKELPAKHPDWYLQQFADVFGVWPQSIQKRFAQLKITRKKKRLLTSEKSEVARTEYLAKIALIPTEKRVYVDECGINTDLKREYGRAVRGKKVEDTKRGRKFHRVNIVAAQVHGKNGVQKIAPLCYQGTMTGEKFEAWVNTRLISCAPEGSTIIMDNARFHRKTELEEIGKTAGLSFLFLPPYSPDFNPIEKGWANMKRELRDTAGLCELLETAMYHYWS